MTLEAEDRKQAMAEFEIAYITVSRYLNGQAPNLILAINLVTFFRRVVSERMAELNRLTTKRQNTQAETAVET